ncbi:50S ribosomal protein L29 [Candidatus Synechococcus spongiarum LMB bulk15N]|uniref:Large ribosomal subunit protein uL29 n=2 Tax=Candidatus Synechococcus spongiarum TaxID=431041 RepID=A0A1T1D668_9SYNE|nr:50S ribosomal protein L29 [Candidatus Synechococcus spongiarum LMB bulk15N]
MKSMTTSAITDLLHLDDIALKQQVVAARKTLFELRCKRATRQLDKSHLFRQTRVKLARLLTIQRQRNQGTPSPLHPPIRSYGHQRTAWHRRQRQDG